MKMILLTLCMCILSFCSYSQSIDEPYDFPIRPGTKEWIGLPSYEAKINAYNIPNDRLSRMSTRALVQTCLNYPELRLIMTRNDIQQGYAYVRSIFNGFRELEKRSDAGSELIKLYKQLDPKDITKYSTLVEQGRFGFQFTHLDILLAQKPILSNMQLIEKKTLTQLCITTYEKKEKQSELNYMFDLSTPIWVVSRILDVDNYPAFTNKKADTIGYRRLVDFAYCNEKSVLAEIIAMSKQYAHE